MAEVVIDIIGKDNFSGTLGNFGNIMTGIKSTIDLVSGAFNAAVGALTPFLDSAMDSENAIANLNATLQSTKGVAGLTSDQLQAMANTLQQVTKFSDETIINGEAMLLTFTNIGADVFPQATEAMLNMAEKFGSVDAAAVQLGKALNDPIGGVTALRRVGVQLTDQQEESIKKFVEQGDIMSAQTVILKELETEFGGLAQAMGDTFTGKIEILKNRFDEIRETIGTAILPILGDLADVVIQNLPALERFGQTIADWLTNLRESGVIQDFADRVGDLLGKVINLADAFVDAGLNSTEFREALSAIIGDSFQIDPATVLQWMDNLDAALAAGVRAHDWSASGSAFGSLIDSFLGSGFDLQSQDSQAIPAIADALNRWLLGAVGAVSWDQWREAAMDNIVGFFNDLEVTGTNAVRDFFNSIEVGITDAFRNAFNNVEVNITNWVRDHIVNPVKQFLGISSPSTVFYEVGKNIIQGLINGIDSMVDWAISAIKGIVADILSPFAPILDLLGIDLNLGGTSTGTVGGRSGSGGDTGTGTGTPSTGIAGTVVNQYFAGATINVGSWDQISYECLSPNPFIGASSNQLVTGSVGGQPGTPH